MLCCTYIVCIFNSSLTAVIRKPDVICHTAVILVFRTRQTDVFTTDRNEQTVQNSLWKILHRGPLTSLRDVEKPPLPSLSSPFTNHKKIFLFPPLPIIGSYNAHRNPISYTFWKLHLEWPFFPLLVVWSVYCFTATSDPTLSGSLFTFVLKMLR